MCEKTSCCKETLNKCFIIGNTSLETISMMFDKISLHPVDLLDFKKENALCNLSSAIFFISKSGTSDSIKFLYDMSL